MRSLCVATVIACIGLFGAEQALACSCAAITTRDALEQSDAAVTAKLRRVVRVDETTGTSVARFHYRVKRVFKGSRLERGEELVIRSNTSEASCGLPRNKGRRYGLLLDRHRKRLTASLCSVVSPKKLRRAAEGTAKGRLCAPR